MKNGEFRMKNPDTYDFRISIYDFFFFSVNRCKLVLSEAERIHVRNEAV